MNNRKKRAPNKLISPDMLSPEFEKSFWAKVSQDAASQCWEWTGSVVQSSGYGQVTIDGTSYGAHRVAYVLATHRAIQDEVIRHSCHNRICCNPFHLAIGTMADNAADRVAADRCARSGPKLSSQIAAEIREKRKEGATITELASHYDVSLSTISKIINHLTYSDAA